jgi:hypothetical protein
MFGGAAVCAVCVYVCVYVCMYVDQQIERVQRRGAEEGPWLLVGPAEAFLDAARQPRRVLVFGHERVVAYLVQLAGGRRRL